MQAKRKNEPKSLEDYLNDVSENPVHKLEVSRQNILLFFPNANLICHLCEAFYCIVHTVQ